jgi:DNA repair protein RadD
VDLLTPLETKPEEKPLWPHQIKALADLRTTVGKGKKKAVLAAPPGAGKTEIAIEIVKGARRKGNSVAFTVPMLSLIDQTVKRFTDKGVDAEDLGVMQAKHEKTKIGAPVQVCSVQTLGKRDKPNADVIIVDECHIRYEVIQEWMNERPDAVFIGLSATPWSKGMKEQWNNTLLIASTIKELTASGVLVPSRVFAAPKKPNLSRVSSRAGDFAEGELSQVMQDTVLVADVVETWLTKAGGRKTLVFAVDRPHAAKLQAEFEESGVKAGYVDANTPREERTEMIGQLERGELQVIVSIGTMTTGVDIPVVSCIQYVRPTRSPILFVQSLARGLRSYPGKTDCLILDHSTTTMRLGLVADINFDELQSGKKPDKEEKETPVPMPRICPECNMVVPPREFRCLNCGAEVKLRSGIRYENGELEEIGSTPMPTPANLNRKTAPEDKERFFGELLYYANERGFKLGPNGIPGWCSHVYRRTFGVWPNAYKDAPMVEPTLGTLAIIRADFIKRRQEEQSRTAAE